MRVYAENGGGDPLINVGVRWRLAPVMDRAERIALAIRYATGRLTADHAQAIIVQLQEIAGWDPLSLLSTSDVLEQARER